MNVVVSMELDPDVQAFLKQGGRADVAWIFAGGWSEQDTLDVCGDAEIVVGVEHLEAILDACPSVQLVQVPWAGVRHVCRLLLRRDGVRLANAHANAYATAQYAVTLALALVNRIVPGDALIRAGRWADRWEGPSPVNLSDKTIGILGAGHIGREVARLGAPFAARVLGMRQAPVDEPPAPFTRIVGREDLDVLLAETDLLFVTLPYTEATRDMIGAEELDRLGPSGYLVNVGRGRIVNEQALHRALRDHRIAGAAVDVWYDYTPAPDAGGRCFPFHEPFQDLDHLLMSPHRAGWTEPPPDPWVDILENVNRWAAGQTALLNEVDVDRGY